MTTYKNICQGEFSFEKDMLVEGGCFGPMTNGTEYKEVRQYSSSHHLLRYYFLTRIYSPYMESILEDFQQGLMPDVVIISSCVWDLTSDTNSNGSRDRWLGIK
ncbi:hypothetical protein ATANTOWER_019877, partial [Ataeniobius toweri]|nr:hypothetical protein [Ataeniobius toweri]